MLYEGNNPIFQTIGVEHMNWRSGMFEVKPRDYSSLAFRISGSATIRTQKGDYCIHSNDILYLPQNTQYAAEYTDTEMIVIHFVTAKDDNEPEVYSFQNTDQLYGLFLKAHTVEEQRTRLSCVYPLAALYDTGSHTGKKHQDQPAAAFFEGRFLHKRQLQKGRYQL